MNPQEALKLIFEYRFETYLDGDDYLSIYQHLTGKLSENNGIKPIEYNFLCWLNDNDKNKFPLKIEKPFLPLLSKISEISEREFTLQYCFNQTRQQQYRLLTEFLYFRKEEFRVDSLEVLVGGSYVNKKNESPSDIDTLVILPDVVFSEHVLSKYDYQMDLQRCIADIDINYLSIDWSVKDLWYYTCLTHLGSEALIKDKHQVNLKNNRFEQRDILRIRMS